MDNITVDSIEPGTHTHDDVDNNSTLLSKTGSNKSVAILKSERQKVLSRSSETPELRKHPNTPNEPKGK